MKHGSGAPAPVAAHRNRMETTALLTPMLVSNCDHKLLYRPAQIFAWHGSDTKPWLERELSPPSRGGQGDGTMAARG